MYSVGQKIIYGENGVCTIDGIAPLGMSGADPSRLYYHLIPLIGTGDYFAPVDGNTFMRNLISREEAESLLSSFEDIEPAVCNDNRFNHVDAFYKELFRRHTPEAMVSIIKGLNLRMAEKKTRSTRAETTMKRAKEILYGELSIVLELPYKEIEGHIAERTGKA